MLNPCIEFNDHNKAESFKQAENVSQTSIHSPIYRVHMRTTLICQEESVAQKN